MSVCIHCSCVCDDVPFPAEHCFLARSASVVLPEGKGSIHDFVPHLTKAKSIRIHGFSRASPADVRAALSFARQTQSTLTLAGSLERRALWEAAGKVGFPTCSFEEIRDRADAILFCNCDPDRTHPRFRERFLTSGPPKRCWSLGTQNWEQLQHWALGRVPELDDFLNARYPVILAGTGAGTFAEQRASWETLFRFAVQSQEKCRLRVVPLFLGPANFNGGEVLTWKTGEPFGPRIPAGPFRFDAVIAVGDDALQELIVEGLSPSLPTLLLRAADSPYTAASPGEMIVLVESGNEAQRGDGRWIPLGKDRGTFPTIADIFESLSQQHEDRRCSEFNLMPEPF